VSVRDGNEMAHESAANTLPLILIVDKKRDLGFARPQYDIATAAHNHCSTILSRCCDQRDLFDKVNICEKCDLAVREMTPDCKKSSEKGISAAALDGSDECVPIIRPLRANFDIAAIPKLSKGG